MEEQPEQQLELPQSSASKSPAFSKVVRAVADGDLPLVISLLDGSISVNTRSRGTTMLHEASKAGRLPIVEELMSRQAEVNLVNRSGCTALHFATLCKDKGSGLQIVKRLLDASAHVNVTSERMDTPLHYAAYCDPSPGAADIIGALLAKRALANARNKVSDSPLINATMFNHTDALKVLVENKADMGQRNGSEKTARDIAKERGCTDALQVLEQMQDPLAQLSDTTELMRTALNQMHTVDMLSADLRRQTFLTEAYESFAVATVAEMEDSARARLVREALNTLQERPTKEDPNGNFKLEPAIAPLTPQQFLHALVTLLLISRSRSGSILLGHSGVHDVLPTMEQQATAHNIGHKELRELRTSLQKSQVELLEMSVDRSCSSVSTSSIDRYRNSKSPSTPGMMSETPSTTTSAGDCDNKMHRRRPPINQARLSVGSRASSGPRLASSPSRKSLPLIDDERVASSEKQGSMARKVGEKCENNESSSSPRQVHDVIERPSSQNDEDSYLSQSSGTATLVTRMPSTTSSGIRFNMKTGHSSDKGEVSGEECTLISSSMASSDRLSSLHHKEDDKRMPPVSVVIDDPRTPLASVVPEDAPVGKVSSQGSGRTSKSCCMS